MACGGAQKSGWSSGDVEIRRLSNLAQIKNNRVYFKSLLLFVKADYFVKEN
ncbi:hypothetical protein HMPREF9389_0809 [Streptococcus sanguinis SK355]|uniref:Uncharacterized protein n=1 Tax=Streptococcus sanguinis SK355 TaxID=888816 RepID=F3UPU9_STRSA|nr:hypothetical protein HMPREF9389_0809 [Streptococcus sanguinis SK355]